MKGKMVMLLSTTTQSNISLNLDYYFQIIYFMIKLFIKNANVEKQAMITILA